MQQPVLGVQRALLDGSSWYKLFQYWCHRYRQGHVVFSMTKEHLYMAQAGATPRISHSNGLHGTMSASLYHASVSSFLSDFHLLNVKK
jgi:hypothetical protein